MDLLVRVVLIAVIALFIIFAAYSLIKSTLQNTLTEQQAVTQITNDLQLHNPKASVVISNVSPSTYLGSWHIIAAVTSNATTPCPAYSIDSFDYPKFSFVNGTDNIYTRWDNATQTCYVYSSVASAPVAIAKSYNMRIPIITDYIGKIGFYNVTVTANYSNTTNAWLVKYSSSRLNYSAYALLSEDTGNVLSNYTLSGG